MKTKNNETAITGTVIQYRIAFLFQLGYVGSSLPVTGDTCKVPLKKFKIFIKIYKTKIFVSVLALI